MRTSVQIATTLLSTAFCAAVASEVRAQPMAVGKFAGFANGAVQVNEAGTIRSVPMRVSAIVSIRGDLNVAELPKGAKVILHGRVIDGTKTVEGWSITYYPNSKPLRAMATRRERTADRPGDWQLQVYSTVLETKPLKLQILPGNGHQISAQDPLTKTYAFAPWGGPKVDGLIVTLDDGKRSQMNKNEIEFGPNPQWAGKGANITVNGGGVPPMAELVMIQRVEPFSIPTTKTVAVRPGAPRPAATGPASTRPAARPTGTRPAAAATRS